MLRDFSKVFHWLARRGLSLFDWNPTSVFTHQAFCILALHTCSLNKTLRGPLCWCLKLLFHSVPSSLLPSHKFSHLSILYLWSLFLPPIETLALFGSNFPYHSLESAPGKGLYQMWNSPCVFPFCQGRRLFYVQFL